MTSSGKELGYTGGVEPSLCQAKGGTQTCSSSTHHNRIILMVLSQISSGFFPTLCGGDSRRLDICWKQRERPLSLGEVDWRLFELQSQSACGSALQLSGDQPAGLVDEKCLGEGLRFRESYWNSQCHSITQVKQHCTFAIGARLRS